MKLVEILARELEVWPEVTEIVGQAADGSLHLHECGSLHSNGHTHHRFTIADDWCHVHVTRPQWQAERDRMKAMEFIDRTPQALVDQLQRLNEPTYEQKLWDRVAAECYAKYTHKTADREKCTGWAFADADYFMAERAERAKRVGK